MPKVKVLESHTSLAPEKYNAFKIIYIDDDLSAGEVIDLKIDGNYITGTLPHLSTYALVGNNISVKPNPSTGDNMYLLITTFLLSLIGLSCFLKLRKDY